MVTKPSLRIALAIASTGAFILGLAGPVGGQDTTESQSVDERLDQLRAREERLLAELEEIRAEIRGLEQESSPDRISLGKADLITDTFLLRQPSLMVGEHLTELPEGSEVDVVLIVSGYALVRHEGLEGFVFSAYLDSADVASIESRQELLEDRAHEELLAAQLSKGKIADLGEKERSLLLRVARASKAVGLSIEEFKSIRYLAVDLGAPTSVFNSLQLSTTERAGRVIDDKLFAALKLFRLAAHALPGISGVKASISIPYKNFEFSGANIQIDNLEIYVTSSRIKAFSDADITAQELLDSATVLVNGNRIQLHLTSL